MDGYIVYSNTMWIYQPCLPKRKEMNEMWNTKKPLTSSSTSQLAGELVGPHTPYFLTDYKSLSWAGKPLGYARSRHGLRWWRKIHPQFFEIYWFTFSKTSGLWCLLLFPRVLTCLTCLKSFFFFCSVFCDHCPFSTIPLNMICLGLLRLMGYAATGKAVEDLRPLVRFFFEATGSPGDNNFPAPLLRAACASVESQRDLAATIQLEFEDFLEERVQKLLEHVGPLQVQAIMQFWWVNME